MSEVTFQQITAYVEDRAKTIIEMNQKNLAAEREERVRIGKERMERVGKLENEVTAIRTQDLPKINTDLRLVTSQLATLIKVTPNGRMGKIKRDAGMYAFGLGLLEVARHFWL